MSQVEEVSAITTGNPKQKTDARNKSGRKTGKCQLPTTSKQPGKVVIKSRGPGIFPGYFHWKKEEK